MGVGEEKAGVLEGKRSGRDGSVVIKVLATDKNTRKNQRVILFCSFPVSVIDSGNSKYHTD